jgi:hypothetical protein
MMRPGKIFIHTEIRLEARFFDDDDVDTDPDTVTFKTMSPTGGAVTYTYGTDANLGRTDTGDFYCDITPDESGEWFWRWTATGNGTTVANEGKFQVQHSPHYEGTRTRY